MSGKAAAGIDRRRFLSFLVVGGPTLAMGVRLGLDAVAGRSASAVGARTPHMTDASDATDVLMVAGAPFFYDLMIEITPENRVRFEVPRAEVGQGIMTAASMMLADNLDVGLADIDADLSPAEVRRQTGQLTGHSNSVRSLWDPIRVICGELRARLVTAGADYLGVPADTVRTEDTHVVATDGRRVAYGTIAESAAKVKVPTVVPTPKPLDRLRVVGTPRPRLDALDIVTGRKQYSMDLPVEGAYPTVLAFPPTAGASFLSMDDSAARAMPGVVAVTPIPGLPEVRIGGGVAVTALTFAQAQAARAALRVQWSRGPMDGMSDGEISELLSSLLEPCRAPATPEGIDAFFEWPYVPHAAMETDDCVADVRGDRAELWVGTQTPIGTLQAVAGTLGLRDDQVTLHVVPTGGAFGRRLFGDPAIRAAQVSQRIGHPVKLMSTRRDDLQHGRNRPASVHHVRVSVSGGQIASFEHRMAGALMDFRHGFGESVSAQTTDQDPEGNNQNLFLITTKVPYRVGAVSLSLKEKELAIPTGSFRAAYSGTFGTINEIVISELARVLNRDEYEFRRELLDGDRYRAVLDKVAQEGRWGRSMPAGTAQGLGMWYEFKSIVAVLMECDTRGPEPRITSCTIAVDPGRAVNPTGIESELIGQTIDGIALAFHAGFHVDRGAIRETGFADYRWARMSDSPLETNVHILPPTQEVPGGLGELGLPAACAAAANAWARATGGQVRRFPITEYGA